LGAASLPYVCGANIMLLLNQFVVVLGTPHVNQPFVHMMCTFFNHLLTTDYILFNPSFKNYPRDEEIDARIWFIEMFT